MVQHVEDFYGVYCLYNVNPKFKGRTYIGFTVDPNRRVKQHNTGKHAGGAWRTSGKGPWEMVVITHGFPNEISALRFEWAWQNPSKSRRLRHISKKSRKETAYDYRFRILSEMLRTAPWNRLTLTVRWLIQSYQREFAADLTPPLHMGVAYGPVKAVKVKGAPSNRRKRKNVEISNTDSESTDIEVLSDTQTDDQSGSTCQLCQSEDSGSKLVRCYHPECEMTSHMTCLARRFLKNNPGDHVIPVGGACPLCCEELLWGDIIRHKHGCYQKDTEEEVTENHWADDLQTQAVYDTS